MKRVSLFLIAFLITGSLFAGNIPRVRGNGGQAYGCVTGDTIITLADNRTITIDKLSTNNSVVNGNDEEMNIYYTLKGLEKFKMFRLETESGKVIKATKGHPFYSRKGLIVAKNIKINSFVLTIDGFEKVTEVSSFLYKGNVFNLAVSNVKIIENENLEMEDPFLGLSSKQHTVILNGFISGDIIIQRLMAK